MLGRAILLGLELLVAADIIKTVAVTPTLDSVVVLAIIVLIRTFLSWSLELEISGRWPWQKRGGSRQPRSPTRTPAPAGATLTERWIAEDRTSRPRRQMRRIAEPRRHAATTRR